MSVTGLCQICEQKEAIHQCTRCGALVCKDHYDSSTGLCTDCATGLGAGEEIGGDLS